MRDRPDYRSYSALTDWMKCSESFRLRRMVGIKEQPSWWLPGGTAFHEATEKYDFGKCDDESIEAVWREEWDRAVERQLEDAPEEYKDTSTWRKAGRGKEDEAWWLTNGPQMALKYVAWRKSSDLEVMQYGDQQMIETEMMPLLGGIYVKMFADRIMVDRHGQILVVDLKTGSSEQPSSLQLGVYKVGVEKLLGLTAEWGSFYNARKGELYPPVRLDQWTEERIGALFAVFDAQERAGQYLPNIGSHCKHMCSVRQWCVYQGGSRHPEDA